MECAPGLFGELVVTRLDTEIRQQLSPVIWELGPLLSVLDPAELANFYAVMDKLDLQARDRFANRGAWKDIVEKYPTIVKSPDSRSRK